MTTLIVDCGSTKATLATVTGDGPVSYDRTEGFNAVRLGDRLPDGFASIVARICPDRIYHYGAGCIGGQTDARLRELYRRLTDAHHIEIHSDMTGAARALCGHTAGIACILGTGSNSCLYDGRSIIDNVPALGYILGDEGSGAVLGRRLLGDIFKRRLPEHICRMFADESGMTMAGVIENVYRRPDANRYMAQYTRFIRNHIDEPELQQLVTDEFGRFVERNVMQYDEASTLPVHFAGSVAYHFESQLRHAAASYGIHPGTVVADPMPLMVEYHLNEL